MAFVHRCAFKPPSLDIQYTHANVWMLLGHANTCRYHNAYHLKEPFTKVPPDCILPYFDCFFIDYDPLKED